MTRDEQKPALRMGAVVVGIVAIVLLYVLAIRPTTLLWHRRQISGDAYRTAYFPIFWLCGQSRATNNLIEAYLDRWVPEDDRLKLKLQEMIEARE